VNEVVAVASWLLGRSSQHLGRWVLDLVLAAGVAAVVSAVSVISVRGHSRWWSLRRCLVCGDLRLRSQESVPSVPVVARGAGSLGGLQTGQASKQARASERPLPASETDDQQATPTPTPTTEPTPDALSRADGNSCSCSDGASPGSGSGSGLGSRGLGAAEVVKRAEIFKTTARKMGSSKSAEEKLAKIIFNLHPRVVQGLLTGTPYHAPRNGFRSFT
jgi:hypothetical protein